VANRSHGEHRAPCEGDARARALTIGGVFFGNVWLSVFVEVVLSVGRGSSWLVLQAKARF